MWDSVLLVSFNKLVPTTVDPYLVKKSLDVITLLLGAYIVVQLVRSAIGGTVGTAFKFILGGIIILALNHLLDTIYFADALKAAGHTTDVFQAPIVHRAINLVGFIFMAFGFQKLINTPK